MNKNKPGLRSYRMKRTYNELPERIKMYFPSTVTTQKEKNPLTQLLPPDDERGFGPVIHRII